MELNFSKGNSPRDYLRIIFRHKLVIIITVIITMATVYIKQELNVQQYVASVKILVAGYKESKSDFYKTILQTRSIMATHAEAVKSRDVWYVLSMHSNFISVQ